LRPERPWPKEYKARSTLRIRRSQRLLRSVLRLPRSRARARHPPRRRKLLSTLNPVTESGCSHVVTVGYGCHRVRWLRAMKPNRMYTSTRPHTDGLGRFLPGGGGRSTTGLGHSRSGLAGGAATSTEARAGGADSMVGDTLDWLGTGTAGAGTPGVGTLGVGTAGMGTAGTGMRGTRGAGAQPEGARTFTEERTVTGGQRATITTRLHGTTRIT